MGAAIQQTWPPFVLVAGLLLIGGVAEADGMFEALGALAERLRGGPLTLLTVLLVLEALVTAVLNLDTAVVFITPIILHAVSRRGYDERPFLYGSLLIANGASLALPGSNLTNLIVLSHAPISGARFARELLLPQVTVIVLTIAFLALVFRPRGGVVEPVAPARLRLGPGLSATVTATVLILVLRNAALPVLLVGVFVTAFRRARPRVDAPVLGGLFILAVTLGTLARHWGWPASLIASADGPTTAAIGAVASVLVNNLPAAALLSARAPQHPLPLLIGLNLGPNLVVTGSLSSYLWFRAAHSAGAKPSLRTVSALGVVLVPLTMTAALAALALVDPTAL